MSARQRPFTIVMTRGDERQVFTFYATSSGAAFAMARAWAKARGWTIEEPPA